MRRKLKSFDISGKDAFRAIFTIFKQNGDVLCDANKLFNFFCDIHDHKSQVINQKLLGSNAPKLVNLTAG